MELNLKEKVVLITGAAGLDGSIGQTIALSLVKEGGIPVIIDRNLRGEEYVKSFADTYGIDGLFVQTDLKDSKSIESAIHQATKKYGRIDVVINNVGVNDGVGLDATYEEFIDSLHLNLVSYFMVTKCALPLLKQTKGNILNIGSKVALTGQGGTSGYAASKGGVLALTREWAVDLLKYGIRSNCLVIAESWTPAYKIWIDSLDDGTEKLKSIKSTIPLENRMTTPKEIADTVLFMISERSSHTTGQFVHVDGGYVHLDRALLP